MSDIKEHNGFSFGHEPEKAFTLHQIYEEPGSVKQVRCANCGNGKLEVGRGDYFTVIRCSKCNHEYCIHEG